MYKTKIIKIGNSLGIIIPKKMLKQLGWSLNDEVAITVTEDGKGLIVSKVEKSLTGKRDEC